MTLYASEILLGLAIVGLLFLVEEIVGALLHVEKENLACPPLHSKTADMAGVGLHFGVGSALIAFTEAKRITRRRLEREAKEQGRVEVSMEEPLQLPGFARHPTAHFEEVSS